MLRAQRLTLVTTNPAHPAHQLDDPRLDVLHYQDRVDFPELFSRLGRAGIGSMTIQTGGTLNAVLLRERLVDFVSVVVAPVLIGGEGTPTLVDGPPLSTSAELARISRLTLLSATVLEHSYLHLRYRVETAGAAAG